MNEEILVNRLIFAFGSPASPKNGGKDAAGLFAGSDVSVKPFLPALSPIRLKDFSKNQLRGVRVRGSVSIRCDDRILASDTGELQFTDYGVSGIPSMQVSFAAAQALSLGKAPTALIDCAPFLSPEALRSDLERLRRKESEMPVHLFLSGLMPDRLSLYFLKKDTVRGETPVAKLKPAEIRSLLKHVKQAEYPVVGVCGFQEAQAASGGVLLSEIDPASMALKKLPGAFVCGEAADICGLCGGYNLQWAWSSGFLAGQSAARSLLF